MFASVMKRILPEERSLPLPLIGGFALALLGWALSWFEITLSLGIGLRFALAPMAGLLAAWYGGGAWANGGAQAGSAQAGARGAAPLTGALFGLMIGSSTFGSLWAPNVLAYIAALALASWLFARMQAGGAGAKTRPWRTYLKQAGVALLAQVVLAAVLPAAVALISLDGKLFAAAGSVLAIYLLPGALVTALLFPVLIRPFGLRYIGPELVLFAIALTVVTHGTPYPGAAAAIAPVTGLHAGAAVADITPSNEETVYLGGYGGRTGPATGAIDPLQLRVLVLQEGDERVTFVTLDAVGYGNRLAARLRQAAGGGNVLVSASHSHAAPDFQGIWGGADPAYEDRLVEATRTAVAEAVQHLTPVTATAAAGEMEAAIQQNRRGWDVTPRRLSALRLTTPEGQTVATLVNYALHPTVLPRENMQASSDFVGPMRQTIEERMGGVALFVNGAQGDVVPRLAEGVTPDWKAASQLGARIGTDVVTLLQNHGQALPATARMRVRNERLELPLANWGFQVLLSLDVLRYDPYLAGAMPVMRSRVSRIELGDVVSMVTAPGETASRLGLRVEEQDTAPVPFFLGLTHDTLGYLIARDEWQTDRNEGYEESVSVGPRAGELYADAATKLLKARR